MRSVHAALVLVALAASTAHAHDRVALFLAAREAGLEVRVAVHVDALAIELGVPRELLLDGRARAAVDRFAGRLTLTGDGGPIPLGVTNVASDAQRDEVVITLAAAWPDGVIPLEIALVACPTVGGARLDVVAYGWAPQPRMDALSVPAPPWRWRTEYPASSADVVARSASRAARAACAPFGPRSAPAIAVLALAATLPTVGGAPSVLPLALGMALGLAGSMLGGVSVRADAGAVLFATAGVHLGLDALAALRTGVDWRAPCVGAWSFALGAALGPACALADDRTAAHWVGAVGGALGTAAVALAMGLVVAHAARRASRVRAVVLSSGVLVLHGLWGWSAWLA